MGPCLPAGWRHVAAVREGSVLRLYVDGVAVAVSTAFGAREYDVTNDRPLTIGFGANEFFRGLLSDLRLYDRPLGRPRSRPSPGARPEP